MASMSRAKDTVYLPGLKELAERADANGKTINRQAIEIGMDRSSYHNLVYCRKTASLASARDIAHYHGVSIESLLESVAEKNTCIKVSI